MASDFSQLKGAIDEGQALNPMTAEQVAFRDKLLADKQALGMVLNDVSIAEAYVLSKNGPAEWNAIDDLYRAYVKQECWPGTNEPMAALPMPLIMEVVESLLPQTHMAFFSDKQPFLLTAKGRTTPAAARATAGIVRWEIKESGFKEENRKIQKSCILYGTGIGKWGYKVEEKPSKKYEKTESGIVSKTGTDSRWMPTFEYVDLRNVLVDPATRSHDIRESSYVIHQKYVTADELDEMRDQYKNVPTREQLAEILAADAEPAKDSLSASKVLSYRELQAEQQDKKTSSDPLKQRLEILEYWTASKVITVLQRKIVLQNEENEFNCLPFVSCGFIDVLNSFYSRGVGRILEGEQRLQTGTINAYINALALYVLPVLNRKKGLTPTSQTVKWAPNAVLNMDGEIEPIQKQPPAADALTTIQMSEARARRRVGANFGSDMPTQALRTAEGVQEFTAGLQTKLQYFIEAYSNQVFIPVIEWFIQMAKDNLTPERINEILSDEDGKAFEGEDILDLYNGIYGVDVLSSTKLAGRRAMAGLMPARMQMYAAAPVQESLSAQGMKLDWAEMMKQQDDIAGWESPSIIVPMTDEDKQRAMMNNPAIVKAQADQAKMAQQHENTMEEDDNKAMGRAGVQIISHGVKSSTDAEKEPQKPLATRSQKSE